MRSALLHERPNAPPGIVHTSVSAAGLSRRWTSVVSGPAADLRRLCRFLVAGAAWAVAGGGSLTLATKPAGEGAALRLEAAGAADGSLTRLLDGPVVTDGAYGLELAACQSLVRRLGGGLRAEAVPGGEAVVVELPAAAGA